MATFTQASLGGEHELLTAAKWYYRILKPISDALTGPMGDTGWTLIAPTAPWVNASGSNNALAVRMRDGAVHVRGALSGGTIGTSVGTLPAAFRPPQTINVLGYCSGGLAARWALNPGGTIVLSDTTTGALGTVFLDGCRYLI